MLTKKIFIDQSDSDDDNNFDPPVLSKYALELLQKEESCSKETCNNRNNTTTTTTHTDQSELETIFTRSTIATIDHMRDTSLTNHWKQLSSTIIAPRNLNSKHDMTDDAGGNNNNSVSSLSRAAQRRLKLSGKLGPAKRAALYGDVAKPTINPNRQSQISPSREIAENEPPCSPREPPKISTYRMARIYPDHITKGNELQNPSKSLKHYQSPESQGKKFDFEDLTPFMYLRKHNLPPHELPRLEKLYTDQQKAKNETPHSHFTSHSKNTLSLSETAKPGSQTLSLQDDKKKRAPLDQKPVSRRQPLEDLDNFPISPLKHLHHHKNEYVLDGVNYPQSYPKKIETLKSSTSSSRIIEINGKTFEKLELLGKGGSSKVFKVKSNDNKVYAVKKITFDEFDDSSISGFKGEIDLLNKLKDEDRVVRLIDHHMTNGSLFIVMECGDFDLSHVLQKRLSMPLDIEFVRFHSKEVLKCVKAVHDAGIVHSDLKPANFLFVKGILKIIDFGIANSVPDHTINVYRETQIGTPNYMAPEALTENSQIHTNLKATWKVGKPSDIWSCGCIIYQMIYGRPPYGGYQGSQRLFAIMNPEIKIQYPENGLGSVKIPGTLLQTVQKCLVRDPNKRSTAEHLLNGEFCKPRVVTEEFIHVLVGNALRYGRNNKLEESELKGMANDVWRRISKMSL